MEKAVYGFGASERATFLSKELQNKRDGGV